MAISRRAIIGRSLFGGVVVGGAALLTSPVRHAICGSPEGNFQAALRIAVGGRCVACNPHLTPGYVSKRVARGDDAAPAFAERRNRDFTEGRVLDVDGWQLAETEVLSYAAAYFRSL